MATPPMILHTSKRLNAFANPVPTDEMAKRKAAAISSFLRPNRSLRVPEINAPMRQPTRAQLIAHPCWLAVVRWKNFS